MPDQPNTSPQPERAPRPAVEPSGKPAPGSSGSPKPKHPRRAIVWPLIVLASIVLVLSIIANWVQREALDTNQIKNTTDQILKDPDVQQALATYTVDQLYANVDVQGQIQKKLPSAAQPLALPVSAAPGNSPPTRPSGRSPRPRFRAWSPPRSLGPNSGSSA